MAESANSGTFHVILKFIWNFVFVILYPVITSFSLIFMGVIWLFSNISSLLSKIGTSKEMVIELKKPTWKKLITVGNYHIEKLFIDDIMFGPTYFRFRSEPQIQSFNEDYFGDFIYPCFNGVLLQKWNSTIYKELPDFTLVYLDGKTGQITEIERIISFSWNAQTLSEDQVKVKWFNGMEGGEVLIDKMDLKIS